MPSRATSDPDLRATLIDAAEAELTERGIANLSLRGIARRVGVSHQAPGHHFQNRAGLLTAVAVRSLALLREQIIDALLAAEHATARERLSIVGTTYVRFASEHAAVFTLATRPELLDTNDEALIHERLETWTVFAHAVIEAQNEGWRADQPPEVVALLCWSVVHGATALWRDGLLPLQLPDVTLEQLAQTVTAAL
jgi:AcrR family transcriptional regulator